MNMETDKPKTKRQIAAEARRKAISEARAAERAITEKRRAEERAAKEVVRARCAAVSSRVPPEYQEWGSVRTRAWARAAKVAARLARGKSASIERMSAAIAAVEFATTAPVDRLAAA